MNGTGQEVAILVGLEIKGRSRKGAATPDVPRSSLEESLEELKILAESAGAIVDETVIQARPAPDSATLIGSGKLQELKDLIQFHEAAVVIFDSELTPTQQRNLERSLDAKVLDRTQLILDIFAAAPERVRANSKSNWRS